MREFREYNAGTLAVLGTQTRRYVARLGDQKNADVDLDGDKGCGV